MNYFDSIEDQKIYHCFNEAKQVTLTGPQSILLDDTEVDNFMCHELGIRAYKFYIRTDNVDDTVSMTYTF